MFPIKAAARAIDMAQNSGWIAGAVDQSIAYTVGGTGLRLASEWKQPLRFHMQELWCLGYTHFHLARILPIARGAVTLGPLIEALLSRCDIGRVATPGFKYWPLQGAPIREAQGPRVLTHGIHGIEMLGGPFGTLAT